MSEMEEKGHWYSFTFMSGNRFASTYAGFSIKGLTIKLINEQKSHAGMPSDSVLISFCYMGYMTREEVMG